MSALFALVCLFTAYPAQAAPSAVSADAADLAAARPGLGMTVASPLSPRASEPALLMPSAVLLLPGPAPLGPAPNQASAEGAPAARVQAIRQRAPAPRARAARRPMLAQLSRLSGQFAQMPGAQGAALDQFYYSGPQILDWALSGHQGEEMLGRVYKTAHEQVLKTATQAERERWMRDGVPPKKINTWIQIMYGLTPQPLLEWLSGGSTRKNTLLRYFHAMDFRLAQELDPPPSRIPIFHRAAAPLISPENIFILVDDPVQRLRLSEALRKLGIDESLDLRKVGAFHGGKNVYITELLARAADLKELAHVRFHEGLALAGHSHERAVELMHKISVQVFDDIITDEWLQELLQQSLRPDADAKPQPGRALVPYTPPAETEETGGLYIGAVRIPFNPETLRFEGELESSPNEKKLEFKAKGGYKVSLILSPEEESKFEKDEKEPWRASAWEGSSFANGRAEKGLQLSWYRSGDGKTVVDIHPSLIDSDDKDMSPIEFREKLFGYFCDAVDEYYKDQPTNITRPRIFQFMEEFKAALDDMG